MKIKNEKYYARSVQTARILMMNKGVVVKSELTTGRGKYISSLPIDGRFCKEVCNKEWALESCPKYVQKFAKKHPRAQSIVYWTKPAICKELSK